MLRLALLCLLTTSAFGGPTPRQPLKPFHGRIIGGTNAAPGEFPSHFFTYDSGVQLSLQIPDYPNYCGASVLSATWALTAAHCVMLNTASEIVLLSGTTTLGSGGTLHQATNVIMHPAFNFTNFLVNDIAVIEVSVPFEFSSTVQPINLPAQDLFTADDADATVIGWGRLSEGGPTPNDLQKVTIKTRNQDLCQSVYNGIGYNIYPGQICADGVAEGIGSCSGDSGGPLFVDGTVVGLVSWAQGCANVGYPTVYTRVASYRDWITQNTGV